MNHIITLLQVVISMLQAYPDKPTTPTTPPPNAAFSCKTDLQFEKRIALVNEQNRHLRFENSELRGYLKAFDPNRKF
jgi:hypothetical protein